MNDFWKWRELTAAEDQVAVALFGPYALTPSPRERISLGLSEKKEDNE